MNQSRFNNVINLEPKVMLTYLVGLKSVREYIQLIGSLSFIALTHGCNIKIFTHWNLLLLDILSDALIQTYKST